jgi:osmotically-inducible protein OsmY
MVETRVAKAASPHPASEEADKTSRPWNDRNTLGLLWDALHRECKFDPSECELEVKDRVAYMRGTVETLAQKRAIAQAARSVPGLKDVVNDLRIAPLSNASDRHIAAEVRAALMEASLSVPVPNVRVVDGVVYLSGVVGSLEARKLAEDTAWSAPGVEYVVNDIATTVSAPCRKRRGNRPKALRDVHLAIDRALGAQAENVLVDVRGGIVHLRGHVGSDFQRYLTEDAVRWVPCVVDVVNDLTVISRPN